MEDNHKPIEKSVNKSNKGSKKMVNDDHYEKLKRIFGRIEKELRDREEKYRKLFQVLKQDFEKLKTPITEIKRAHDRLKTQGKQINLNEKLMLICSIDEELTRLLQLVDNVPEVENE